MERLVMMGRDELQHEEDAARPEQRPGESLIEVTATALGLTQAQALDGRLDTNGTPRVLGHEIVGRLHSGSAEAFSGTRVVVCPVVGCGLCARCMRGQESVCARQYVIGLQADGGWAGYCAVPARQVLTLVDRVTDEQALLLGGAIPTAVHAVRRAALAGPSSVAVNGLGTIGEMLCRVSRAFGATRITGVDLSDDAVVAVDACTDGGVNVSALNACDSAKAARDAGRACDGFDVVFEASGTEPGLATSIRMVRPGGKLVLVGAIPGAASITFEDYTNDLIFHELDILASSAFNRGDVGLGIELLSSGRLDVPNAFEDELTLAEVPVALEAKRSTTAWGKRCIVRPRQ